MILQVMSSNILSCMKTKMTWNIILIRSCWMNHQPLPLLRASCVKHMSSVDIQFIFIFRKVITICYIGSTLKPRAAMSMTVLEYAVFNLPTQIAIHPPFCVSGVHVDWEMFLECLGIKTLSRHFSARDVMINDQQSTNLYYLTWRNYKSLVECPILCHLNI
jgi:hypothetical protein